MDPSAKVTFVDAVRMGFSRATDFTGRSTRSEFWYWVLFLFIIRLVTTTLDAFVYPDDLTLNSGSTDLAVVASELATTLQHSLWSSTMAVELLLLLPLVALSIRRFRDAGWSTRLAAGLFALNYGGIAVGYLIASSLLADLTVGGVGAIQDVESIAAFFGLFAFVLIQATCLVVLAIGGLQRSRASNSV
jgi:uncharacterized membrane protein YhaH (DUF805 family)